MHIAIVPLLRNAWVCQSAINNDDIRIPPIARYCILYVTACIVSYISFEFQWHIFSFISYSCILYFNPQNRSVWYVSYSLICDYIPMWRSSTTKNCISTLRPWHDGSHFTDNIFKWIFLNKKVWILIEIPLKFVSKGLINNNPALVQIMAWRRPGDKPLSEPMMVSLLAHICVTRPQWVN